MAYEGIAGALGAVNSGMTDARKSRMELYLKNAQLHQMAEQEMFAKQQAQQYAMIRQKEADLLASNREEERYRREGFVGDAFEPALRAYAEKHKIAVPEGRITKSDAASLLSMIKADGANAAAMAKINNINAGGSKKIAELLFKLKQKAVETRNSADTMFPELEKLRASNAKSRSGYLGAAQQMYDSATNNTDSEDFKATAETMNGLKDFVGKVLKSTFGAQLSDGERQWMQTVVGASEKMSKLEREIAIARIKSNLDLIAEQSKRNYEMMGGAPLDFGPSDEDKLKSLLDGMDAPDGSSEDSPLSPVENDTTGEEPEAYDVTGTEEDSENFAPHGTDALGVPSLPAPPKRKR